MLILYVKISNRRIDAVNWKKGQKRLNKTNRLKHRFCEGKGILHRIGHILHVSNTKNMILKAENIPRIGDSVADENLKQVGTVFDVFGPTSAPYVAVKPHIRNPEQLVNHVLYAVPSKTRTRNRNRR
jgi:RNA-binding protein